MAEYGDFNLVKKKETRKPPVVVFGIVFGEESHLDYEPNSKLKVNQNDLLIFFRQMSVMLKSGVPLSQALELLAENMTKPFGDTVKVNMSYNICAPRMYRGRIESIVSRTTGFADMINITSLKLQQVISRMVPDGVYLDVDGLAEVLSLIHI